MKRFIYPLQGFFTLLKKDRNFILHLIAGFLVVLAGLFFRLTTLEWLFVIIAIFTVLVVEVLNTSVEYVVDLVTEDYHELAKHAKDTAAFAVVLASLMSALIGLIIFIPYILMLVD
ncbi:diacylglycerol kinase family protein [Macrococcus brunensis]|uniref:diacylglycerol kinase family protein n=1 Tax=Macrococcus brunensis TaxID=198483 RepID=UPI001EF13686|nr:diacylglycerol kinase family protein [Macrococcus brunensis]ULG71126.1 diacylglycerol kinase family protein [Macrococcus brunensis]ULG73461.1 diacylglycerol kinase family protein [Macrococcus brunensis]